MRADRIARTSATRLRRHDAEPRSAGYNRNCATSASLAASPPGAAAARTRRLARWRAADRRLGRQRQAAPPGGHESPDTCMVWYADAFPLRGVDRVRRVDALATWPRLRVRSPESCYSVATMASKSFYDWLVEQKNQRSPLGEFAREMTRDPAFPKEVPTTLDAVLDFIRASPKASDRALAIARTAYRTYARG